MRSLVLLIALTATVAYLVVRQLPEGAAHAAPVVVKTQEVHSISIDGGRGLPIVQLREVMETEIGTVVDTATLERDRRAMQASLEQRGYLGAKVAAPVVTYGPSGGVYVVFDIERGPLFHIRTVQLEGEGWARAGVIPLAAGDDAVGSRLERVRQAVEATLTRAGKATAVELAIEIDHDAAMVDVRLSTGL